MTDRLRMGIRIKRRLVAAWLIVFALWPLAHHALVRRYAMNPWKLFGWAMYCVPASYVHVWAYDATGGGEQPIALDDPLLRMQDPVLQYIHARWVYGMLLPPDTIAGELFARRPALQRLQLDIDHLGLDRESAHYRVKRFTYNYDRTGLLREDG